MSSTVRIDARLEAMGDVPGVCELPLTRAIVQYREVHETDVPGGRIEDVGIALVMDGRYAATSDAIDLGSGRLKVLDLSTELVILDWVYEPTYQHMSRLITAAADTRDEDPVRRYAFDLGLRVLERVGFGPLTRPTFLRIGYRDICRDLDLHEGTSIRFVMGPGRLARTYLDYDVCALAFRTAFNLPDAVLERALLDAFPSAEVRRIVPSTAHESIEYRVSFPLPTSVGEARSALTAMRRGLASLMARFEPGRFGPIDHMIETFGARETLATLRVHERSVESVRLEGGSGSRVVH